MKMFSFFYNIFYNVIDTVFTKTIFNERNSFFRSSFSTSVPRITDATKKWYAVPSQTLINYHSVKKCSICNMFPCKVICDSSSTNANYFYYT